MSNQIFTQWSKQEDQLIKLFVRKNKLRDWPQVLNQLKKKFPTNVRTVQQCRERYLQLVDKQKQQKKQNEWSSQQLNNLIDLFLKHGLKWTYISQFFPQRTENCVKNKFYNNLRKAARKLADIEHNRLRGYSKSSLTCQMLTIILQLCHQLVTVCQSRNIKISMNSTIFEVRKKILGISFTNQFNLDQENAYALIKEIRKLNSSLRCFGVYKTKKRKNWNLNAKKLQSVIKLINLNKNDPTTEQIENEQQILCSAEKHSESQNQQTIKNQSVKIECIDQNINKRQMQEPKPQEVSLEWVNWMNHVYMQNQIYWSNLQSYFNHFYYSDYYNRIPQSLNGEVQFKETIQSSNKKQVNIKEQHKKDENHLNKFQNLSKFQNIQNNLNIKYNKDKKNGSKQFQ